MPLRFFGLLLLFLGAPTAASAQTVATQPPRPAPSVLFAARVNGPLHSRGLAAPDTVRTIGPTYWKEGAIAGGVAGAVSIGFLGYVACGLSEQPGRNCLGMTLLGGLFGAALGAIPGALIGGAFRKGPKRADNPAP